MGPSAFLDWEREWLLVKRKHDQFIMLGSCTGTVIGASCGVVFHPSMESSRTWRDCEYFLCEKNRLGHFWNLEQVEYIDSCMRVSSFHWVFQCFLCQHIIPRQHGLHVCRCNCAYTPGAQFWCFGFWSRHFYKNTLTGPIPDEYRNLTNLVELYVWLKPFSWCISFLQAVDDSCYIACFCCRMCRHVM